MSEQASKGRWLWRGRVRRLGGLLHGGLAVLLAVLVTGMLHVLAERSAHRWDVSRSRFFELSGQTRSLLDGLAAEVDVFVFFESGHELTGEVTALLREYAQASRLVRVDRVDPHRDPGRAEELVRRFPVTERNVLVVHAQGRSRIVRGADLATYEPPDASGRRGRMRAFHGEALLSTAILSVTRLERPVVYFLEGMGARSIEAPDPAQGLSTLARMVRQDNIDVRPLDLARERQVPEDADALVLGGPRFRFPQPLLDRLDAWLDGGGRAVFLLDSGVETGLEPILRAWGVRLDDDRVVDPTGTVTGQELLITRYGRHAITERFAGVPSVMYRPRSVEPLEARTVDEAPADRPRVVPLFLTSEAGWAERDPDREPAVFNPGRDRAGPVAVAAAVERGAVAGVDAGLPAGRLVVFGDSSFVTSGRLTGGNGGLFLASLNWLLERKDRMDVPPRAVDAVRLPLSSRQLRMLFWLAVVALPGAVAVFGFLVRLRRRA